MINEAKTRLLAAGVYPSNKVMFALLILTTLLIAPGSQAQRSAQRSNSVKSSQAALWLEPIDIKTRNLFYGPGGKERQPNGRLMFLEEDMNGTNPKFLVKDEQGVRWKIKLGPEAQPEVVATRLLWAVGYFVDEDYYQPQVKVVKLPRLRRGQKYVSANGMARGARLERDEKGDKKLGEWDWFNNPYVGTRELNGLRVMMALINNWDPKDVNNSIRPRQGVARAYYVSDLGSSFGRGGSTLTRTRNKPMDYARAKFIHRINGDKVDFALRTRPSFFMIFYPPYYSRRTRLELVTKDIPRADALWIGNLLGQLSPEQIADAFRAGGYTPEQVAGLSKKVCERIAELKDLQFRGPK